MMMKPTTNVSHYTSICDDSLYCGSSFPSLPSLSCLYDNESQFNQLDDAVRKHHHTRVIDYKNNRKMDGDILISLKRWWGLFPASGELLMSAANVEKHNSDSQMYSKTKYFNPYLWMRNNYFCGRHAHDFCAQLRGCSIKSPVNTLHLYLNTLIFHFRV